MALRECLLCANSYVNYSLGGGEALPSCRMRNSGLEVESLLHRETQILSVFSITAIKNTAKSNLGKKGFTYALLAYVYHVSQSIEGN